MIYFGEIYPRIYTLLTAFWWVAWSVFITVFVISLGPAHIEKWKYKGQYTYIGIIFFIVTMVIGLLFWIFLPSPEYLGFVK